jgi:hypothetical protein
MDKGVFMALIAVGLLVAVAVVVVRWSSTPGMEDFVVNGCPAGTPACNKELEKF